MRRVLWIVLMAAALAAGCDDKKKATDGTKYQPSGYKPANARRDQVLPSTVARALDKGARAPAVQLASVSGPNGSTRGTFHLADTLAKERALIVFYRGDW